MVFRLILEETRIVTSLVEMFGSPTIVRKKFREQFHRHPSNRLIIYGVYEKSVLVGSVVDGYKGMPELWKHQNTITVVQESL